MREEAARAAGSGRREMAAVGGRQGASRNGGHVEDMVSRDEGRVRVQVSRNGGQVREEASRNGGRVKD